MKVKSAKAKGRRLQQWLAEQILARFTNLEPDDVKSIGMGQQGEDIQLSPFARSMLPFAFECKNTEKLSLWAAYRQAQVHAESTKAAVDPVLVIKRNNYRPLVVVDAEVFLDILRNYHYS